MRNVIGKEAVVISFGQDRERWLVILMVWITLWGDLVIVIICHDHKSGHI